MSHEYDSKMAETNRTGSSIRDGRGFGDSEATADAKDRNRYQQGIKIERLLVSVGIELVWRT